MYVKDIKPGMWILNKYNGTKFKVYSIGKDYVTVYDKDGWKGDGKGLNENQTYYNLFYPEHNQKLSEYIPLGFIANDEILYENQLKT